MNHLIRDSCINSFKKKVAPEVVPRWLKNRNQRVHAGGPIYEYRESSQTKLWQHGRTIPRL